MNAVPVPNSRDRLTRSLIVILLTVLVSSYLIPALAQTPTPTTNEIKLLQPVKGSIDKTQGEQRWIFNAQKGWRLAVRMQATSGNLDPYFDLLDPSGKMLVTASLSSFHNATLDAFDVPATGQYTLRATRATADTPTSGEYVISLLPVFSLLVLNDPIDAHTPIRTWKDVNALSQISDGWLRLQLKADSAFTWTAANKLGKFKDLYIQADVRPERVNQYWEAGLLVRGVERDTGTVFYVLFINSKAQWKLAYSQTDKLTILQDWTALPAESLKPAQDFATLGLMANGDHFTVYYNGLPVGEATDSTLNEPGLVGLTVGTGRPPDNLVSALFKNIVVTLPGNQTDAVIIPQTLTQWQRAPEAILGELYAARVIPSMGKLALGVDTAFVTNNTPGGIVIFPLAKDGQFTDLVYAADVTWDTNSEEIACAMEFRAADANNFSIVYFDRHGGYGIRQVSDKQGVILSLYDLNDAILKANKATNRILIVAIGNGLVVYINGVLMANADAKQVAGSIYIAAYNYQPASSACQFNNIWVQDYS